LSKDTIAEAMSHKLSYENPSDSTKKSAPAMGWISFVCCLATLISIIVFVWAPFRLRDRYLFLLLSLPLIGMAFGIAGVFCDARNRIAKVALALNILLIVLLGRAGVGMWYCLPHANEIG